MGVEHEAEQGRARAADANDEGHGRSGNLTGQRKLRAMNLANDLKGGPNNGMAIRWLRRRNEGESYTVASAVCR
jgi:hypothetical protein